MKIKFWKDNMEKKNSERVCIDIGCGSQKKKGTLGVDFVQAPGVDYVVDLANEPLPFDDSSVDYVFSSHFVEHMAIPSSVYLEISRVCKPGGQIELWTPYVWSNDAFIMGHTSFQSEENYLHMCVKHPKVWSPILKKRWLLQEIQYVVRMKTLEYLKEHDVDLSFAIRHYQNIVKEIGVHIKLASNLSASSPTLLRTFSISRDETRYELKNTHIFDDIKDVRKKSRVLRSFAKGDPLPPLRGCE